MTIIHLDASTSRGKKTDYIVVVAEDGEESHGVRCPFRGRHKGMFHELAGKKWPCDIYICCSLPIRDHR